jgi:hypothetical protein
VECKRLEPRLSRAVYEDALRVIQRREPSSLVLFTAMESKCVKQCKYVNHAGTKFYVHIYTHF